MDLERISCILIVTLTWDWLILHWPFRQYNASQYRIVKPNQTNLIHSRLYSFSLNNSIGSVYEDALMASRYVYNFAVMFSSWKWVALINQVQSISSKDYLEYHTVNNTLSTNQSFDYDHLSTVLIKLAQRLWQTRF